jgi:ElaB/YqjD/DUF883 family membrane-anchored ribosome-binding protein
MSDNFSDAGSLDPKADLDELRSAAGDQARKIGDKATELKDRTVQSAQNLADLVCEKAADFKDTTIEKASALKSAAVERAVELREAADERVEQFRTAADEHWREARAKVKEAGITTEDYIRAHPTRCVLGALGLGFIIGMMTRD